MAETNRYQPPVELVTHFKASLRPPSIESRQEFTDIYTEHLQKYFEERKNLHIEELIASGEHPRTETPFDVVHSPTAQPLEEIIQGQVDKHFYLEALTHPLVIESFRRHDREEWQCLPPKQIPVLDRCLKQREAVTYEDFVLSIGEDKPEITSAQELLGTGLVMWGTNETSTLPISGSSMSALVSAMSMKDLGIAGALSFVPVDGRWNDPHNQVIMLKRAHVLLAHDPLLLSHPDAEYLIQRATGLMGITLKSSPENALWRVQTILNEVEELDGHKLLVRLYDPRGLPRMLDTTKALRDKFGDRLVIIGGKVTTPYQAFELANAGVNAIDIGVGEGEICDTPGVTSSTGNNILTAYRIAQSGLPVPLICDGGTGRHIPIAVAIGASVAMKSRALTGGTFDQNPVGWQYYNDSNKAWKPYFGEASEAEKWAGGKIDPSGRDTMFVEGTVGKVLLDPRYPSTIKRLFKMLEGLATAGIFQRVPSLEQLQVNPQPDVWRLSPRASISASLHHK